MRLAVPLALFTAAAFSSQALPVRAYPGPSINLVRIDREGVQPLPDVSRVVQEVESARQDLRNQPALAQAETPAGGIPITETSPEESFGELTWLLSPGDELEINFSQPLPANATGELLLRTRPAPGSSATSGAEAGEVVERIPFPSEAVFLSDTRLYMAIAPESLRNPGEITTVEFVLGGVVPEPETPVRFALAQPAIAVERKVTPCPILPLPPGSQAAATQAAASQAAAGATAGAAAATAGWVLPVILGAVIIGVGAAVISISGDGDGGGRNPVSK